MDDLQSALESSQSGDIIVLGNGRYHIKGAYGIEEGGTIKSIGTVDKTIICPTETECGPSLLDFSGGEVLDNNLGSSRM